MKNEKLELLLNKVVDFYRQVKVEGLAFNQTILNCKGIRTVQENLQKLALKV